jgi:hypothetical protein
MSILSDYQVSGGSPSTVATSGTSAVYFPRVLGPNFNLPSAPPSGTNATGQLPLVGTGPSLLVLHWQRRF